ncbi:uncharacterized protein N7473_011542 [Penicillium subrubescens]|uniref:uncharacterized protein n=1 Tax=Penicillium subrubescens TaxID=1316194 RepID=UPI002545622C|nr:uncharacterized protein N7473_011542 [Penicillium subrubescens]KAJ5880489.1 hypothetical protein N7473_011542 [Penicillium subrubescens]
MHVELRSKQCNPDDENGLLFGLPTTAQEDNHPKKRCECADTSGERLGFSIMFLLLLIPLALSILLLYSDTHNCLFPENMYNLVNQYRSSVQTAVQIVSATLAAIEVFAICRLINLATRIRFKRAPVSLDMLGFWSALSIPAADWNLPIWMIIMTVLVANLHTVLTAVWTGALTPVNTLSTQNTIIQVPHWSNISLIKEYPSQIDRTGPSVRNSKGYFTYSVGMGLLGSLLGSANSASSLDGGFRNHNKLDNTRFQYHGRSYGAGSSIGLTDQSALNIRHAINYTYSETALAPSVSCIYNSSSRYAIDQEGSSNVYPAKGYLPDSASGSGEYTDYVGFGTDAIVALAVSRDPRAKITVHKMTAPGPSGPTITDLDPYGNITHVVMRQLALISADQTSFYRSTVGDVFNASIGDYGTLIKNNTSTTKSISQSEVNLEGAENTVISLVDDMLVAYASAQLVVGGLTVPARAFVNAEAIRAGSPGYIITSAVIIIVIVILVTVEAVRMRGWRALPAFDYTDARIQGLGQRSNYVERRGTPGT